MSLLPSRRPPPPMKAHDFDHEIRLVDRTLSVTPTPSQSMSPVGRGGEASNLECGRRAKSCSFKYETPFHLRQKLRRRKFAKYGDRPIEPGKCLPTGNFGLSICSREEPVSEGRSDLARPQNQRGTMSRTTSIHNETSNIAIDVLFENQRGGFLCGKPFFSARALGNLDPAPWTTILQKPSATNIYTAQPPDPSWEWVGEKWSVHDTECIDKDGWEYSFAFHGKFSWHKGRWWNSFVRRRAWVRKRIKKKVEHRQYDVNMLNLDYFTVHPGHLRGRSHSSSRDSTNHDIHGHTDDRNRSDKICDIGTLRNVLRSGRIDREKIDAVKNFIENGNEELVNLKDQMHDIMRILIFHASRHALVAHLRKVLDENFSEQKCERLANERREYGCLAAALEVAEEEIELAEI